MVIYIHKNGMQQGPFSLQEVQEKLNRGEIALGDRAWQEGTKDWGTVATLAGIEIGGAVRTGPAAPVPPSSTVPPHVPGGPVAALYAGFWKRVGSYIIDLVILVAVMLPLGFLLNPLVGGFDETGASILGGLIELTLSILYFSLFESSRMQGTPGKRALGVAVTDLHGQRLTFARALGRNVARILSGLIFLIGYIMVAFTARKQALHDMIAGTLVINRD
jgi:uncharacterized RDD family membrane protein YckC